MTKAFDCIVHDFLIAKLEVYGFTYEALNGKLHSDRAHKTKMNDSYRSFWDLLIGVP